jgi:translation initiation factor IF-1
MCACTETDVRESASDCTLASGEGHGSRGETFHPFCAASPVSSSVEHPVYTNPVRTSHETHYASAKETNRLMLFAETVAVYCENHMEHKNTLCGQNADLIYNNPVRTSQETNHVSATETNRLMLFAETVAVYCENHTEHINTLCGQNAENLYIRIQFVPHRKHITSPLQSPTG